MKGPSYTYILYMTLLQAKHVLQWQEPHAYGV